MQKIIQKFRQSEKTKTILRYLILLFFGMYIFSISYFGDRKPLNYLVYGVFAFLSLLVVAYRFLYQNIRSFDYRIFFFLCFALFASIGTILYSRQFRYLLTVFLIAISFSIVFLMLDIIKDNNLIIRITIYSIVLFSLLFIIHYRNDLINVAGWGKTRLAADNYFDNVNGVAYYFAICSIFSLYCVIFGAKPLRFLFFIPFFLCLLLGVLTASRTFLVSAVLCCVAIFIVKFRKKRIILFVGLGIISVFIILFLTLPAFKTLRDRFVSMFNMLTGYAYSTDYSTATRVLWQDYATYLGVHHVLFGNGINGFAVYSGTGTYSHANVPELICDTGILGVVLYYLTPAVALRDALTKNTKYKTLIIILFVFLVSREFLDITYYAKINALIFGLMSYSGAVATPRLVKTNEARSDSYYCLEI